MRPMRKSNRATSETETIALLERGSYGVLATAAADGEPLATPLSYVWMDGGVYFHCAAVGHKLDNIAQNPRVCFCVAEDVAPLFEDGDTTTRFESAVVHGQAALVADIGEKRRALEALCLKYFPQMAEAIPGMAESGAPVTTVVRITPQGISGKARRPGN